MSHTYDVAIIGAGVVGASIARELSRYRLSVALLEKEAEPAFGVSKSNSGIIHPGTQHPASSLKARLCVQGNLLVRKIARDLGVDFKEVGELIVAFSEDEALQLLSIKKEAEKIGVPGLKMVSRVWLHKHEPNLNPKAVAALLAPTAGIISPYRLAYDLIENALKNSVELFSDTRVESVSMHGDLFEIFTTQGSFRSRYLVNAAGLFADTVAKMLGISDIEIIPRKGEEFLLDKKLAGLSRHLLFPIPTKTSKGVLIIKTADGNPMIGPTAQDIADKSDLSTSNKGLEQVLLSARKLIPSIDASNIIAYFAGLRPVAGEDFIVRLEGKVPRCVTVAGIQSPGLTASPAIAILVRELLVRSGLEFQKKSRFYAHRKKTIHLFSFSSSKIARTIKKDHAYGDIVCRCEMVSSREIKDAISRGAKTLDGVKFRTRAQAGRCHGGFCTTRILKLLAAELMQPVTAVSKRGKGSELIAIDKKDSSR